MNRPRVATVLIVSRDPEVAKASEAFRREGMAMTVAQSFASAQQMLRDTRPLLVVLDGDMPPSEGLPIREELLRARDVATLLLVPAPRSARFAHAPDKPDLEDYLVKPVSSAEMVLQARALMTRAGFAQAPAPPSEVIPLAVVPSSGTPFASDPSPSYSAESATGRDEPPPLTLGAVTAAIARHWWLALLIVLAVMASDVAFTLTRTPTYLARTTLVIRPSGQVDQGELVNSVDTLGRGRIVGTYQQVLGSEVVQRDALAALGYSDDLLNKYVQFTSSTVADAAVIQITAESPSPEFSAEVVNEAGQVGIQHMAQIYSVYDLVTLTTATPPTAPSHPDPVRNYSIGLLLSLILATALPYLFDVLTARRAPKTARAPPQAEPTEESQTIAATARPATQLRPLPARQSVA